MGSATIYQIKKNYDITPVSVYFSKNYEFMEKTLGSLIEWNIIVWLILNQFLRVMEALTNAEGQKLSNLNLVRAIKLKQPMYNKLDQSNLYQRTLKKSPILSNVLITKMKLNMQIVKKGWSIFHLYSHSVSCRRG